MLIGVSRTRSLPILVEGDPPEFLVHDQEEDCPYLPGERSRFPFRLPVRPLRREELAARLADGDRRNGPLLYRPSCPTCDACRPIRLDVQTFEPRARHRRSLRQNDERLEVEIGPARADGQRVRLYNAHLAGRGLSRGAPMDLEGYRQFLTQSCCDTFEIRYRYRDELVGVAITDRASDSLSSVYCYYDPEHANLGIGTYSILKQIELARASGLRWVYLGLYVVGSEAMAYKATFVPNEQLVGGEWVRFDEVGAGPEPRAPGTPPSHETP